MKPLWIFVLVSMIEGPAIISGSVAGAVASRYLGHGPSGQPGLFIGATVGGIAGVVTAASVALRLGLIPAHRHLRTIAGGVVGFGIAGLAVFGTNFDSPIVSVLSGTFVPLGAVIGSRDPRPDRPTAR